MIDPKKFYKPIGLTAGIPYFTVSVGSMYIAPRFFRNAVLVLNQPPLLSLNPADLDGVYMQDLEAIHRRWPDQDTVLFGWDPDPSEFPRTAAYAVAKGIQTMYVPAEIYRLTLIRIGQG